MDIRKAVPEQLDLIMKIYEKARIFMAEHGNPDQWGESYPPRELVEEDIRDGNLFVCMEEETIAAVFFYREGEDETYREIFDGAWLCSGPYGVVHRIASAGVAKGAASCCLRWALKQCGDLRIDTHRDNRVMQGLLSKEGFTYCGRIYDMAIGEERLAYETCGGER